MRAIVCGGSAVPASLMRGVRGAPRHADHPGVGDDRDEPARLRRAPAGRRRGRRRTGATAPRPGRIMPLRRGAPDRRRRRGGRRGTASRPASSRCAARGSPRDYYEDPTPAGEVPRRLAAHRRHRVDRRARLHPDLRPLEGRHQVRRRVDLLGRARERADGAPRGRRGGGDRQARRALVRAPARVRRARGGRRTSRPRSCASTSPSRVAKWWVPDEFAFIDEVPKTSVGKFDKKVLRKRLEEGELETVSESEPASRSA